MKPMWTAIVILLVAGGTAAPLLLPASDVLARRFWPGPTVKGPADVYVQAFQVLVCLAAFTLAAIVASVTALIIASSIGWRGGQWLSGVPIVALAIGWAALALRGRLMR